MKIISKAVVGTIAAGAMVIASASPAFAGHRDGDKISVGDVIAGALIIGGIVAVASAAGRNDRDGRYGSYGYRPDDGRDDDDGGYEYGGYGNSGGYRGSPRQAIAQCVRSAEQYAGSRYGRADVTDIREVRDSHYGWQIKGRIAVSGRHGGWQRDQGNYGSGWGGDYRGWNPTMRGYDSGSFRCKVERGRVVDLDLYGI